MDTSQVYRYICLGHRDKNWYQDCKEVFLKLFPAEDLWLVCQLFAATSINTSLRSNVTLFRRAYSDHLAGRPVSNYLPNIHNQLVRIREGAGLSGRKINAFAAAMYGDPHAVVVDVWLLRAFELDKKYKRHSGPHEGLERSGGPTDRQFSLIESWCRQTAEDMGVEARQVSAMIWAGIRTERTGSRDTHYKQHIEYFLTNLFGVI